MKMQGRLLLLILLPLFCKAADTVAGYYPFWTQNELPANELQLDGLTHVLHAFAYPRADGSVAMDSNFLQPELVPRVHEAGKHILVALGGWGNSQGFAPMAADSTTRRQFVENIVDFCNQHDYDGVDLDWEHPSSAAERRNLSLLVAELRREFDHQNPPLLLTMAVTGSDWNGKWLDYEALAPNIDWFGCMSYDFHGPWTNHAGHNSPLYPSGGDVDGSVSQAIAYLTQTRNVPPEKVLLGIPFYGRGFNAAALYSPATGNGGEYRYSDILRLPENEWTRYWDDIAKVPYLINTQNTKLISYDDTLSVRLKAEYAIANQLRGVMIWALGQDAVEDEQPLLRAVAAAFESPADVGTRQQRAEPTGLIGFPNPGNNRICLQWYNPVSQTVRMRLVNIRGRVRRLLADDEFAPGRQQVFVDTRTLAAGIYLVHLQSGTQHEQIKLAVVK